MAEKSCYLRITDKKHRVSSKNISRYNIVNRLKRHLNKNHVFWMNDFENKKKEIKRQKNNESSSSYQEEKF